MGSWHRRRAVVYGISVRTIPPCLRQTRYLFRKSTKNLGQEAICPEMGLKRSRSYCGVWLTYRLEPEYDHYASQLNIKHIPFYDLKKTNSRKKNCGVLFAKEVCVWMRNSEVVIILKDIFRQLNCHIVKYSVKFIISIHRQEPIKFDGLLT